MSMLGLCAAVVNPWPAKAMSSFEIYRIHSFILRFLVPYVPNRSDRANVWPKFSTHRAANPLGYILATPVAP
jgi:hypothetical protein